jgi:predicted nucleic acid-binding protein
MARDLMTLVPTILSVRDIEMRAAIAFFDQYGPKGLRSRDAIHAAAMQTNGLTQIISSDQHFDLIPGITRLDPNALYQSAQSTP